MNTYSQIQSIKNETQFYYPYANNSIEKVYKYLKRKSTQTDIAIEFSLKPIVIPRTLDIKAREIFYDQKNSLIHSFYLEYTKTPPFFYERTGDIIYYIEKWPDRPVLDSNKRVESLFYCQERR